MERLKFLETMTVNEFKSQKGVKSIEVKQNPHTGKSMAVRQVQLVIGLSMEKSPVLLFHKCVHQILEICSTCYIKEVKVML